VAAQFLITEDGGSFIELEDGSGDLLLEDGNPPIDVPFIAATTTLFTPTVANNSAARVSQLPAEVVLAPDSGAARISQVPAEVVLEGDPAARVSQAPVEVIMRNLHESVAIIIID